ncbi:MFS transporter [Marinomonas spartinae]|uniref:MFS transporter n=1 Tax=Marinomonas spartinae TaxID=1792290 RepID=UPI0018F1D0E8|nr:MFS transporter [Marinomonas spartinae]MBJ7553964.1 MFS transporter [Marinomonas spartinae]
MIQLNQLPLKMWVWLGAKQLSDISAFINTIVISVYALSLYDNPIILGFILALKMSGSVMGAFLTPVLSRFWSHRIIQTASDYANGIIMLALAFSPEPAHPALIVVLPFFMGLFQGTFHVSLYTQVPQFLGANFRHQMNSLLASIHGIAVVIGGILAGILYDFLPVQMIFLIDGGTFLLSGVIFFALRINSNQLNVSASDRPSSKPEKFDMVMLKNIWMIVGVIFIARFIEAFGSSTHNVGFPILSREFSLENPAFLVGWIMALWGAGKIFASVITPMAVNKLKLYYLDESSIFICFLAITFLLFLGVFWSNSLWVILLFSFLAGIFDAATETVYYAILQHSPEGLATDRLISISYFIERAGMGLGILLVGYAFSIASTSTVSGIFYLVSIIASLFCLGITITKAKEQN